MDFVSHSMTAYIRDGWYHPQCAICSTFHVKVPLPSISALGVHLRDFLMSQGCSSIATLVWGEYLRRFCRICYTFISPYIYFAVLFQGIIILHKKALCRQGLIGCDIGCCLGFHQQGASWATWMDLCFICLWLYLNCSYIYFVLCSLYFCNHCETKMYFSGVSFHD